MGRHLLYRHLLDRDLIYGDLRQMCLRQLCLPRRDLLSALCAFVTVGEFGQVLGLVSVDSDDDPGSPQGSLSE